MRGFLDALLTYMYFRRSDFRKVSIFPRINNFYPAQNNYFRSPRRDSDVLEFSTRLENSVGI